MCCEMAEASISQDQFNCPVCLDLLKVPVTIPCGHSYCMSCITGCWDQDDQKGVYSCPQCRHTYSPRPLLGKNVVLAEMLEKLMKTKLQTAGAPQSYAGPGDVECDICTGRKYKAVKSCLVCLESYCQTHFERHEEFRSGKQHKMADATGRLQEMICHQHDKLLEVYCCTDQQCICMLCTMDEHKNHDTVSIAAQRTEKEKHLKETQRKFQQRIQEREKELQELREAVKSYKCSAQAAVEDNERIFTELIRSIERSRSEVTQLIRDQEKAAVSRAQGLLERLEQVIADLRRRYAELEQLSHTDDHIHFLQSFQALSVLPKFDVLSIAVSSFLSFEGVEKSLSCLRKKLEEFCQEEIQMISGRVSCIQIIPVPDPKTRKEFLQLGGDMHKECESPKTKEECDRESKDFWPLLRKKESHTHLGWNEDYNQFTLDPNTLNNNLYLSEGNRMATYTNTVQQYPAHPDRFDSLEQVLCREGVCGRCYWEVEWSNGVGISVSYKSISKKGAGNECLFGCNDQSWKLSCTTSSCSFYHNNRYIKLPVVSSRIGVYVDHSGGTLSFYSVSNAMTLIHRIQTTFKQPLYPGFRIISGSSAKLCDLTV